MTRITSALVALFFVAMPALAEAPVTSPHPILRPAAEAVARPVFGPVVTAEMLRPVARPEFDTPIAMMATKSPRIPASLPRPLQRAESLLQNALRGVARNATALVAPQPAVLEISPTLRPMPRPEVARAATPDFNTTLVARSPMPRLRPKEVARRAAEVIRTAATVLPTPAIPRSRNGSVCGDPSIRGERLSPIAGRLNGCGVDQPVRVTMIDGVALSQASVMDCTTANALKTWINDGVRPAVGRTGGGLKALRVAAHYSCRTRNNQPGAKISEHGRGRAIDISAIKLADDTTISVLKGWRDPNHGPILKRVHQAACGPFGTVLGPNSDRFHQDHFHFDTARYRSGAYCR